MLARELQAHLRTKDSLLEKKDEALCTKDRLLEKKDEDVRSLLEKKDADLRTKDRLLEKKDEDLTAKAALAAQLKLQQFELIRYKNIVNCRGALEFVASQIGLSHPGDEMGWRTEFDGALTHVLISCNENDKIVQDNGGRPHKSPSLAAKVK